MTLEILMAMSAHAVFRRTEQYLTSHVFHLIHLINRLLVRMCPVLVSLTKPAHPSNRTHSFNAATALSATSLPKQMHSTLTSSTSFNSPFLPIYHTHQPCYSTRPFLRTKSGAEARRGRLTCGFAASLGRNCPTPLLAKAHSV